MYEASSKLLIATADSTPPRYCDLEKIDQIEQEKCIPVENSREGTNEINSGVACFLLRDVEHRAERLSQRNDIIRDDPNRFFRVLADVEIFGTLTGFQLYGAA